MRRSVVRTGSGGDKIPLSGTSPPMMVSLYAADLVKNNSRLDDVIISSAENRHKGIKGFFMVVKEIRKKIFYVGILLRPKLRLAFLLFLIGVKYRIGTGYRFYRIFFNQKVYVHRKMNPRHQTEYNLDLVRPLGIRLQKILSKVHLSPEDEEFAYQILDEFKIIPEDMVVAIHRTL